MSTVYCPVCRGLGAVDMLIDYLVLMTNAIEVKIPSAAAVIMHADC